MRKILVFIITLIFFSACTTKKEQQEKPIIMVTIGPLRYLTQEIVGDLMDVEVMVPSGNNPETYEPTARQMVGVSNAAAYIAVGDIGFERTWMKKIMENAPLLKVTDASKGIQREMSRGGIEDPHVWMSCPNAKMMANNILEALVEIMPEGKETFVANKQRLTRQIDNIDMQIRNALQGREVAFAIYHPMLTYYARDYHLRQYPIEEEGREPSAKQLQDLIREMKADNVKVIFQLKEFNTANIRSIANTTEAKVIDINPLSEDWGTEMVNIAKALSSLEP